MAILEKVTQEDLILYEILRNPVLFFEFISNFDRESWEDEFKLDIYQKEFMLDFNSHVSISCARSVGKTASLSGIILWILIFNVFPDDYIVYTVPNKVHLEPVWNNYLVKLLKTNSFLKQFMDTRKGINGQDYTITTKLGSSLICRIAGTSETGRNVIGLHTPFTILDESAFYPYKTFLEMQPIIKTHIDGYRLIVSGVPNGLRERNVNWQCQNEDTSYSKHHVSAFDNPRFTERDKEDAIKVYGGEDSDDYIHNVLGLPGQPIFSLFNRELMQIENYPVYKISFDGISISDNIAEYINKLSFLPSVPNKKFEVLFGIDLGYSEPTAIFINYLDEFGRIKFHAKISLVKVNYFMQEKIIDYLDSKYGPSLIGIDEGSTGKAIISRLIDNEEYLHKNYKKKVHPINFSANTNLGRTSNGEEINIKTKPLAVNLLQDYTNQHKIIYSSTDLDTIIELERMTYIKSTAGEIIYRTLTDRGGKRGEDHFTSALLCMVLSYYMNNEVVIAKQNKKKLAQSSLNVWSVKR